VTTTRLARIVGVALDLLREDPGSAGVAAAVDAAEAALAGDAGHPAHAVLAQLVADIEDCRTGRRCSSPGLEASFRAAAAALTSS